MCIQTLDSGKLQDRGAQEQGHQDAEQWLWHAGQQEGDSASPLHCCWIPQGVLPSSVQRHAYSGRWGTCPVILRRKNGQWRQLHFIPSLPTSYPHLRSLLPLHPWHLAAVYGLIQIFHYHCPRAQHSAWRSPVHGAKLGVHVPQGCFTSWQPYTSATRLQIYESKNHEGYILGILL